MADRNKFMYRNGQGYCAAKRVQDLSAGRLMPVIESLDARGYAALAVGSVAGSRGYASFTCDGSGGTRPYGQQMQSGQQESQPGETGAT